MLPSAFTITCIYCFIDLDTDYELYFYLICVPTMTGKCISFFIDLDTDYDLYFYLPQRNGYASLPYPIKLMGSAFSISLWVRYYEATQTGTFFTMFTTP